jgi:hypothetical protein
MAFAKDMQGMSMALAPKIKICEPPLEAGFDSIMEISFSWRRVLVLAGSVLLEILS